MSEAPKVVPITPGAAPVFIEAQPVADVVAVLEAALERAKEGLLSAVAVAAVEEVGGNISFYRSYARTFQRSSDLLASMIMLRREFERECFDG